MTNRINFWHVSCFKSIKVNKPTVAMKTIKYFCLLLLTCNFCIASPTQSIESMQDAVHRFITESLSPEGQYQISSAQIDVRLQLPTCDQKLDVFSQSGAIRPGRNTIGIRCSGRDAWTIYSTVLIKSFKQVLVLKKQLNRDDRIRADYLGVETRNVASLQHGYLTNLQDVVNKQATRFIPAGTALNRSHYAEPTLVNRGDQVRIQSGKAGLLITSRGIALNNGTKGQKIRVKNVTSKRIIQATVVNPGVVTVYF